MKFTTLNLLTLGAMTATAAGKLFLEQYGIEIGEIDPDTIIDEAGNEILFTQRPNSRMKTPLKCDKIQGYQFTFTPDRKFVACCLPGQLLVGSKDTDFDCCGAGHHLAGSKDVGFSCCPLNHTWDGNKCNHCEPEPPVCQNGKILVNGMCVCPAGTVPNSQGGCGPDTPLPTQCLPPKIPQGGVCVCPLGTNEDAVGTCVKQECTSGLVSGKCYTFTFPNGHRFGHNRRVDCYTASGESRDQQFGKFKLCKDEACTPGFPVNPGEGIKLKDLHGDANGGQNAGQFLNDASNGDHIRKTPNYAKAGNFTLTKWPCGKYCLGGLNAGVGPTCPNDLPSATFTTHDKQSCIPIDILEVPCDIHAKENNCIWTNGADQCCDKVNCREVGAVKAPEAPGLQVQ